MGVIGVVAALTLPNLNSSTSDKEVVTKVKKIYQNLNDAFGRAEAVYGPYSDWFIGDANDTARSKRAGERITEFMKTSKVCAMAANQGCFVGTVDGDTTAYKIITADGTSIRFSSTSNSSKPDTFFVDIDGPTKGNNSYGKDTFNFEIPKTSNPAEIIPAGYNESFSNLIGQFHMNYGAAWIIKFDNADYLKFTDNNGTCPNGTTVTEANPRCK